MTLALITNPADLQAFKIKFKDQLHNLKVITPNLNLANIAIGNGLRKIEMIRLDYNEVGNTRDYHHDEADRFARILDADHAFAISKALGLDFLAHGWQYLNLYYIIYNGIRTRFLSETILKKYSDRKILIHQPSNQPYFYFDSWFHKEILSKALSTKNEIALLKTQGLVKAFTPNFEYKFPTHGYSEIGHFPTIYYEQERLKTIIKSKPNMLQLPSQFWDIDLGGDRASLNLNSSNPTSHIGFDPVFKATKKLFNYFRIDSEKLPKTASFFHSYLNSQAELFKKIENNYELRSMTLSDHDTSISGPLLTFAQKVRIPVEILPHSFTTTGPMADTELTTRTNLLRSVNSFNCLAGILPQFTDSKKKITELIKNKNVMFLFNAFEDVSGLPTEDYVLIFKLFERLAHALKDKGVSLKIRYKPHFNYKNIIRTSVDEATGPLENWVSWPSLVFSIGQPTTALAHFESCASITHVQTGRLSDLELGTLSITTNIINESNWLANFNAINAFIDNKFSPNVQN